MYTRIRALREDHDLTQAQMAKLLHIHQTTYSSYELGTIGIPIAILAHIADYFATSIDYLVGRTDEAKNIPGRHGRISRNSTGTI